MEVSATRTRRFAGPVPKSRTITGPTPHSVSIVSYTYKVLRIA